MNAKTQWIIGRDTDCDIVIDSKSISRKQAEILQNKNIYILVNHSKHRTSFLKRGNKKFQVDKIELKQGDLLFFADEGPFDFEALIDADRTVIDFNPLVKERSLNQTTDDLEFQKYIKKRRCIACASIIAKEEQKCPECGNLV